MIWSASWAISYYDIENTKGQVVFSGGAIAFHALPRHIWYEKTFNILNLGKDFLV